MQSNSPSLFAVSGSELSNVTYFIVFNPVFFFLPLPGWVLLIWRWWPQAELHREEAGKGSARPGWSGVNEPAAIGGTPPRAGPTLFRRHACVWRVLRHHRTFNSVAPSLILLLQLERPWSFFLIRFSPLQSLTLLHARGLV